MAKLGCLVLVGLILLAFSQQSFTSTNLFDRNHDPGHEGQRDESVLSEGEFLIKHFGSEIISLFSSSPGSA